MPRWLESGFCKVAVRGGEREDALPLAPADSVCLIP